MRFNKKLTVIAAGLAMSVAAFAQSTAGVAPANKASGAYHHFHGGKKQHKAMTAEDKQKFMQERAAEQAKRLNITAAQQPQWNAYVQARSEAFGPKHTLEQREAMRKNVTNMNAEQRAQFRAERMAEHAKQQQKVADATKNLRAVLTPAQQTEFDNMGKRGMRGKDGQRGFKRGNAPTAVTAP